MTQQPKPILSKHQKKQRVQKYKVLEKKRSEDTAQSTICYLTAIASAPLLFWVTFWVVKGFLVTCFFLVLTFAVPAGLWELAKSLEKKIPAVIQKEKWETVTIITEKFKHYCQKCDDYLGVHKKGTSLRCGRCRSNRSTIVDPLQGKYHKGKHANK